MNKEHNFKTLPLVLMKHFTNANEWVMMETIWFKSNLPDWEFNITDLMKDTCIKSRGNIHRILQLFVERNWMIKTPELHANHNKYTINRDGFLDWIAKMENPSCSIREQQSTEVVLLGNNHTQSCSIREQGCSIRERTENIDNTRIDKLLSTDKVLTLFEKVFGKPEIKTKEETFSTDNNISFDKIKAEYASIQKIADQKKKYSVPANVPVSTKHLVNKETSAPGDTVPYNSKRNGISEPVAIVSVDISEPAKVIGNGPAVPAKKYTSTFCQQILEEQQNHKKLKELTRTPGI